MSDLLTVVIPLYNKVAYISRAINSVLNQTYQSFTLIIIDDGSTDESLVIANSICDYRIKIFTQENQGVSASRNRGVELSNSKYIAFLDADDEWKPNYLERMSQLIDKFPNCGVYGSGYEILLPDGTKNQNTNYLFPMPFEGIVTDYIGLLLKNDLFCSSSVIVRKAVLVQVGGFPAMVKNGEDVDTWIRLSMVSQIAYLSSPLAIYHLVDEITASSNYNWQDEWYPIGKLREKIKRNEFSGNKDSVIEYISKYEIRTSTALFRSGKLIRGLYYLWVSRKTKLYKKQIYRILRKELISSLRGAIIKLIGIVNNHKTKVLRIK